MGDELSQEVKKSIPKFTSFRSKAQGSSKVEGFNDPEKATQSADADKSLKDSDTLKTNDDDRGSSHEHHPLRRRHHHRSRHTKEQEQSLLLISRYGEPLQTEDAPDLFLVDKVGDPKNLTYGTLHRHAIPIYFRFGGGSVIGSTPGNRIDRSVSGDKVVVLSSTRRGLSTRRDKKSFYKNNEIGRRKLRIRFNGKYDRDLDAAADFLPLMLASATKRKHCGDEKRSDSSESSDGAAGHYRSIEGKAKGTDQPDNEDIRYSSDKSASDFQDGQWDRLDEGKQHKRIELARKTEADPTEGDAWLDLINYQDEILGIGRGSHKLGITIAERHSNAEVKISIYERAIDKVSDPKAREKLLLGLMEEGLKVWENSKLSSKWRCLLCAYPECLGLWIKYLDYKQTTCPSFKYEDARSVYFDCLSVLQRARSNFKEASVENNILYENQAYILLRMTVFMREAGFTENAIAVWQAVLEWQMFRPNRFQSREHAFGGSKASEATSAFEEFWESEVPRIGEEGAEGWASYIAHKGEPPRPQKDTERVPEDETQLLDTWASSERRRDLQSRAVARTIDEVDENDPYRVILFSDVGGSLIDAPASPSGFALLFDALLAFCHFPPLPAEQVKNCSAFWRRDCFLRNEVLHQSNNALSDWRVQNVRDVENEAEIRGITKDLSVTTSCYNVPFNFPIPDYQISPDCLFAAYGTWFSAFGALHHGLSGDHGPVEIPWIRRTLKALVHCNPRKDYLAEYYLAFETGFSPKTATRVAKSLIKAQPDSLRLYNAYAMIRYRSGNTSSADDVMATAINMGRGLEEASRRDTVLLWHTWMWEMLSSGRTSQALRRLLMYPEEVIDVRLHDHGKDSPEDSTESSPSILLRTQTALTSARDRLLSLSFANQAVFHADLLILLTYLTTLSLSSALSTFKRNLLLFPPSPAHELLHQSFSRLLYHHATHNPSFSPSIIRSSLADSIQAYPKNTIFLSLYAWIESRFRIDDRVRSVMKDVVLTNRLGRGRKEDPPSIVSHFFAVHTELHRSLALGSNTNTVRATFQRAVSEDSVGAHSAGLWKLYFWFEKERGDAKKAREVFWRGVRACPWAKELYLLAFDGQWKMGMGELELRGVLGMMEDKELRIHKGIGDVREELAARQGLSG